MPRKKRSVPSDPLLEQSDLLSTILIVQLLQAGVAQKNIGKLANRDINRVNKIAQLLRKPKRKGKK
jgi:phage FluMu protein gp41